MDITISFFDNDGGYYEEERFDLTITDILKLVTFYEDRGAHGISVVTTDWLEDPIYEDGGLTYVGSLLVR